MDEKAMCEVMNEQISKYKTYLINWCWNEEQKK